MQKRPKPTEGSNSVQQEEHVEHVYDFVLPAKQKGLRLDAFITHSIQHATRTRVQRSIDSGNVTVNGITSRSNYRIKGGDVIRVVVMKPPPLQLIPQDIPLEIVYEDDDLVVINKNAGMTVHPGIGNRSGTLVNAMLWHVGQREPIEVLRRAAEVEAEEEGDTNPDSDSDDDDEAIMMSEADTLASDAVRPGVVHRLDKDTSGLIVMGKHYKATMLLSNQFRDRTVTREYIALLWGVVKNDFEKIEGNIDRSPRDRKLFTVVERGGKTAATDVTVLERYDFATLVRCKLHTGRTHQIRVHCSHSKHPILGDRFYGGTEAALKGVHSLFKPLAKIFMESIGRQALHARTLGFNHPITNKRMEFACELPPDIMASLEIVRPTSLPFSLE
ncbi:MAG: RluA family pseudouridine synthase [Ignavibacteria bacterium]|nr:RluA family pseudouridine synthase [Ignavibacteria bacterium]